MRRVYGTSDGKASGWRPGGAWTSHNVLDSSMVHGPVVQAGHIENLSINAPDALNAQRRDTYEDFVCAWAIFEERARQTASALWTTDDPYEYTGLWSTMHEAWLELRAVEARVALLEGDETPAAAVVACAQRAVFQLDPVFFLEAGDDEQTLPMVRSENQLNEGRGAVDKGSEEFRAFLRHGHRVLSG